MFLAEFSIDAWLNLLTPEVVMAVVGLFVTWYKGSEWYEKRHTGKEAKLISFLEAGIHTAYEDYVRGWKKKGRKLTKKEVKEATKHAIDSAVVYAKKNGVDLLSHYSKEMLPLIIARLVKKAKTKES